MKIQKTIFYILMFLPLPVTLISLVFLPDQIPAHYGSDNQVTRWGSKYETLLFQLLQLFLAYLCWEFQNFLLNRKKMEKTMKRFVL